MATATVKTGLNIAWIEWPVATYATHALLYPATERNKYVLQTANWPSIDRTDRRTDGRTPERYIYPAPHIAWAASINRSAVHSVMPKCVKNKNKTII